MSEETMMTENTPIENKFFTNLGWVLFALFCLIFFTVIKLPKDKLKDYIIGSVNSTLSDQGITYTAKNTTISYLFGIKINLQQVSLTLPPPAPKVTLDEITLSPSLLNLLIGKFKASFDIKSQKTQLGGMFSLKGQQLETTFRAEEIDLGKLGVFTLAAGIDGSALLSGSGDVTLNLADYSSTQGSLSLSLKNLGLEPQTLFGFAIPKISISEGTAYFEATNGKLTIKQFKLGKNGNKADDINGSLTGTITLAKYLTSSKMDLNTKFGFSENVMKSFILLETLLGPGKQPDGTYSYNLKGPLTAPVPTPIKP